MKGSLIARCLTMMTQVTLTLIAPIIVCLVLGLWLDDKFGWSTTVPLLILGFISGGRSAYVLMKRMLKEAEKESAYDR